MENNILRANRTIDITAREPNKCIKYGAMTGLSIVGWLATAIPITKAIYPQAYGDKVSTSEIPNSFVFVSIGLLAVSVAASIWGVNRCYKGSANIVERTDIEMATVTANRLASIPTQAVTEVYRDNTHQVVEGFNNEELSKFTTNRDNLSLSNKLDTSNNISSKKDNILRHNVSYAL